MIKEFTADEQTFLKDNYKKIDGFLKYSRSKILDRDEQRTACLNGLIRCCRESKVEYIFYYFKRELQTAERIKIQQKNLGNKGKSEQKTKLFDISNMLNLQDNTNVHNFVDNKLRIERIKEFIENNLTKEEKFLFVGYFFENKKMDYFAERLCVSRQRVHQKIKAMREKLSFLRA